MRAPILATTALLIGGAAFATHFTASDANMLAGPNLTRAQVSDLIQADLDVTGANPLAVAFIPGPLTSYAIDMHLFNASPGPIQHIVFDAFRAYERKSLLVETCWSGDPTVHPMYPLLDGRGPMVLHFDDFFMYELRAVSMDPDTYEDPVFGAMVGDMVGSLVEVVFADGHRGMGRLTETDFGNVAAYIYPTYVSPLDTQPVTATPIRMRRR